MLAVRFRGTGEYIGQVGVMRRIVDAHEHHYLSYLLRAGF